MANQLTLRGFDPALERELHCVAAERDISLNKAALLLMRRGAGISESGPGAVAMALDKYSGSWSAAEEKQFRKSVQAFDQVDESFWK